MGFIDCPNCAQSVSDGTDSCAYCGTSLPGSIATGTSVAVQQAALPGKGILARPPFFAVSLMKLTVLSICTFGLYEIYWFYRNWKRIQEQGKPDISPFWRAFFSVIFCYPLFKRIQISGVGRGVPSVPQVGLLAIGYILTLTAWRLPHPYALFSFCSVFFLLPIQLYANRINEAELPGYDPNLRFSIWNWTGVIVGGVLFLLAIAASFMPPA